MNARVTRLNHFERLNIYRLKEQWKVKYLKGKKTCIIRTQSRLLNIVVTCSECASNSIEKYEFRKIVLTYNLRNTLMFHWTKFHLQFPARLFTKNVAFVHLKHRWLWTCHCLEVFQNHCKCAIPSQNRSHALCNRQVEATTDHSATRH